jgi:hypothetical protein
MVIAAAVSLRQIGALPGLSEQVEPPPYVLMTDLPLDDDGFAPAERIGPLILTQQLHVDRQPSLN